MNNQKVYIYVLLLLLCINVTVGYSNQSINYKVELVNINTITNYNRSNNYILDVGIYDKVDINQSINYKECTGFFCFDNIIEVTQNITAPTIIGSGTATIVTKSISPLMSLFGADGSLCKEGDLACLEQIRNRGFFVILAGSLLILIIILTLKRKK